MSFIIRAAFWLTVLAFLLPSAKHQVTAQTDSAAAPSGYTEQAPAKDDIGAADMMKLASQSAGDVMGFCQRNREVCSQGHAVLGHVADQTTYYGGKLLLWLTEKAKEQENDTQSADSSSAPVPSPAPRQSRNRTA